MTLYFTLGAFFLGSVFGCLVTALLKASAYDQGLHDGWRAAVRYAARSTCTPYREHTVKKPKETQ